MLGKCGICFDWFSTNINASSIVTTMCGHVFHGACIKKWIAQNPTCVTCRKPIEEKDLTKLFIDFCYDDASETTLDGLKQKLLAKDLECVERDEKISEMRTHCARYESEISKKDEKIRYLQNYSARSEIELERMLQQEMNLKNEISEWKRKVESYSIYEAKRKSYNEAILEHKSLLIDKIALENVLDQIGSVDTLNAEHAVTTFRHFLTNKKLAHLKKVILQLEKELLLFEGKKTHLQTELQFTKDELKISESNFSKMIAKTSLAVGDGWRFSNCVCS